MAARNKNKSIHKYIQPQLQRFGEQLADPEAYFKEPGHMPDPTTSAYSAIAPKTVSQEFTGGAIVPASDSSVPAWSETLPVGGKGEMMFLLAPTLGETILHTAGDTMTFTTDYYMQPLEPENHAYSGSVSLSHLVELVADTAGSDHRVMIPRFVDGQYLYPVQTAGLALAGDQLFRIRIQVADSFVRSTFTQYTYRVGIYSLAGWSYSSNYLSQPDGGAWQNINAAIGFGDNEQILGICIQVDNLPPASIVTYYIDFSFTTGASPMSRVPNVVQALTTLFLGTELTSEVDTGPGRCVGASGLLTYMGSQLENGGISAAVPLPKGVAPWEKQQANIYTAITQTPRYYDGRTQNGLYGFWLPIDALEYQFLPSHKRGAWSENNSRILYYTRLDDNSQSVRFKAYVLYEFQTANTLYSQALPPLEPAFHTLIRQMLATIPQCMDNDNHKSLLSKAWGKMKNLFRRVPWKTLASKAIQYAPLALEML